MFKFTFLLICLPLLILSSPCSSFIEQTIKKTKTVIGISKYTLQEQAFIKFTNSESGITEIFRDQLACNKQKAMKYFVAIANMRNGQNKKRIQQGHGVCLPRICDNLEDRYDQELIIKLFTWKKWTTSKDVKYMLYDPEIPNAPKTTAFYGTCFIFVFLITLTIASTHIVYQSSKTSMELPLKPDNHDHSSKVHWIYKAFDIKENFTSLLQTAKEQRLNENLSIFSFLRVITSWWVVYYHTQANFSQTAINYDDYWAGFREHTFWVKFWVAGDLSVELFFVMTGFLSAYTLLPKLTKLKFTLESYLSIIKHRFIRIWPALMLAFGFYWLIVPQMFNGSMWFLFEYKVGYCDQLWWTKALMIENITNYYYFAEAGNYCMIVTWYIPTEFQIYLVAVLAVALYAKYRKIGFTLICGLIIQSLCLALHNVRKHKLSYYSYNENDIWHYFKGTPFTRWYTLFIGVIWGILYYEYSKLQKKNIFSIYEKYPIVSYISMTLGLALGYFTIMFPTWTWSPTIKSIWYPMRILLISIAMTMVFMPLASNRDFYLKRFMNLRIFQVMGKYSYMTYLFSDAWIYVCAFTDNTMPMREFTVTRMLSFTMKVFFTGQFVAIIAHMIIEKPLLNIEAHLSRPKAAAVVVPKKVYKPIEEESTDDGLSFVEDRLKLNDSAIRKLQ